MADKNGIGRPSVPPYSDETADRIVSAYANGALLAHIAREDWAPELRTIHSWMERYEDFAASLDRAREAHAESLVALAIEITDDDRDPQRARVRSQARQWLASKVSPARYGDKLAIEANVSVDLAGIVQLRQNKLRSMRDQETALGPQGIDLIDITPLATSDAVSVDAAPASIDASEPPAPAPHEKAPIDPFE